MSLARRLVPARYLAKLEALWVLAWAERSSARDTGWAVGIGVWAGASPALFVRPLLAVALATLFRKNRLFSYLGSLVTSNFVLGPWIVLAEVQLAHRLRTGGWMAISIEDMKRAGLFAFLADWSLGFALFGTSFAVAVGTIAYGCAKRRADSARDANEAARSDREPRPA